MAGRGRSHQAARGLGREEIRRRSKQGRENYFRKISRLESVTGFVGGVKSMTCGVGIRGGPAATAEGGGLWE